VCLIQVVADVYDLLERPCFLVEALVFDASDSDAPIFVLASVLKLRVDVLEARGVGRRSSSVSAVLARGRPTQVLKAIVGADPINVVYMFLALRVLKERLSHEAVDATMGLSPILVEVNPQVAITIHSALQQLPPALAPDLTQRGDFVVRKVRNLRPEFSHFV